MKALYKLTNIETYLEWCNDWITLQAMADHYDVTTEDLLIRIDLGRKELNDKQIIKL